MEISYDGVYTSLIEKEDNCNRKRIYKIKNNTNQMLDLHVNISYSYFPFLEWDKTVTLSPSSVHSFSALGNVNIIVSINIWNISIGKSQRIDILPEYKINSLNSKFLIEQYLLNYIVLENKTGMSNTFFG